MVIPKCCFRYAFILVSHWNVYDVLRRISTAICWVFKQQANEQTNKRNMQIHNHACCSTFIRFASFVRQGGKKNLCILVVLQFTHFREKTNAKNICSMDLNLTHWILCIPQLVLANKAQNGNDKNAQQVINHIEWQNLLRIRFSIVFRNVFFSSFAFVASSFSFIYL